jgi:hypothetical protein
MSRRYPRAGAQDPDAGKRYTGSGKTKGGRPLEERYNVYFAGQVMDGFDLSDVRSKLAKVFNADQATLDKLFCGKPQLIKRECDKATALKFKQALERAGAIPVIQRAELPTAVTNTTPAPAMTAAEKIAALAAAPDETNYLKGSQEPASADTSGIVLAPPGTEVLRENERAEPVIREVDTSELAVDATAERLSQEAPPPPAAPDTSHLSMGDVGDTIPNLGSTSAPLSPNLDGLALSAAGTDFSDCAGPEPSALLLDLTHLTALAPGDTTVDEQRRKPSVASAPSIDHISLED